MTKTDENQKEITYCDNCGEKVDKSTDCLFYTADGEVCCCDCYGESEAYYNENEFDELGGTYRS